MNSRLCWLLLLLAACVIGSTAAQAVSCNDLPDHVSTGLSTLNIHSASEAAANDLNITQVTTTNKFTLCRVQAEVAYGFNDTISVELWLPSPEFWNGRYLVIGLSSSILSP